VCSHLLGNELSLLSIHRDGHHGTPAPEGLTDVQFIRWLDDLQAEWVRAARRLSPQLVADLLVSTGSQLVEVMRQQDPRLCTARVSWAGPDPVPVWLDQVRELSECWIHRQQLLQALGRPSDLRPAVLGPILDGLRCAYPFRLAHVRAEAGATVLIAITGSVSAAWPLVATPTGWEFQAEPGPEVVASLSMTTEQAWRLLSNNLPADEQGRLQLSGEKEVVDALRATRAIIGTPN